MQFTNSEMLQMFIQLAGLAVIYTRIKTDIAVIKTKLRYIEQRLKIVSVDVSESEI